MQIHDLNTKALTNPAYVAFDDGTDTYKADFKAEIDNAAASAVADADLTDNTVAFTSGDAASPTAWTAVDVLTSGLSLKTLFNLISTMVKNVRYIWNLLGSSSFSNVASTLTGAIGNTALTTTAQTLSGAIAEHESDINTLNSKFESGTWTPTIARANTTNATGKWIRVGNMVWCSGSVVFSDSQTNQGNIYILDSSLPITTGSNRGAFGWGTINGVGDLLIGAAPTNRNQWISVGGVRLLATTSGVAGKTMQFSICYAI